MKKEVVLLGGATLVGTLVVGVLWYTALPIVQVDLDGKCRRVMVVEQGREVVRPCSSFKSEIYLTEYVAR